MRFLEGVFAAGLAVAALAAAGPAAAEAEQRTVLVRGVGSAAAAPDMATVEAGVATAAATAAEALAGNSAAMAAVFEALREAGIAERDMRTVDFSISPRYADRRMDEPDDGPPRIVGYRVDNAVSVRVRDLGQLGPLLDTLVSSGANRISAISFGIADEAEVLAEARRAAVRDAAGKARLYAEAAGVALGPVLAIDDTGGGMPRPAPMRRAAAMDATAVPVAGGETTVTASVTITWAIADGR